MTSKNEWTYLTTVSPIWGINGLIHVSSAPTLVGLETPPAARNLEFKPYAVSRLITDRLSRPATRNEVEPDAGIDVKYGVTKGLTADFSYNGLRAGDMLWAQDLFDLRVLARKGRDEVSSVSEIGTNGHVKTTEEDTCMERSITCELALRSVYRSTGAWDQFCAARCAA